MNKLPFEKIEREILIKKDSKGDIGIDPSKRKTEDIIEYGVVNIDKPQGPTSHQVSDFVQRILKIKKAGHSGTLDPNVTGVLAIALGRATRIVQTLLPAGKEYICLMHVHKEIEEKKIRKVLSEFVGKIKQMPPIKSAVKRVLRDRKVYYIDIIDIASQDVLFRVGCQAGTYIRTLCHDIGKKLGCGAHMQELRRTQAGPFKEDSSFTLQDLTDAFHYYKEGNDKFLRKIIQPIEDAVKHLPKIWVDDQAIGSITHGIDLKVPGVAKIESMIGKDDLVAIMTLKDELVAIGNAAMGSKDVMKKEKGIVVNVNKVFMNS